MTNTVTTKKQVEEMPEKRRRRGGRRRGFKMPARPAIPVKGLWEAASLEQKEKAHQQATVIMEYWMGRMTKEEVAKKLHQPTLRVWQLSQQAISGMVAGLLHQPKVRQKGMTTVNKEDDPKYLKKRIAELEQTIATQDRLIAVLREMPGCRDATIPMPPTTNSEEERNAQKGIHSTQTTRANKKIPTGARNESRPAPAGRKGQAPAQ